VPLARQEESVAGRRQTDRWQRAQEHERTFWQERGDVAAILAKRKPVYAGAIERIGAMLPESPVVVDVGSGPTCWGRFFPGTRIYIDSLMAGYPARWGGESPEGFPAAAMGEALPLRDDCCDLVVSFNALDHFADPEAMVRECMRVLRPGGLLAISVYVHPPLRAVLRGLREALGLASAPHPFSFTHRSALDLLTDSGLEVLEAETLAVVSFHTRPRFYQRTESLLLARAPGPGRID
jgi:SAM-dependent methyltransferase